MNRDVVPFVAVDGQPFDDWPKVGELLFDLRGDRRLMVREVHKHSRLGRNVIGTMSELRAGRDGAVSHVEHDYACDVPTMLSEWGRPS